MDSNLGAVTGEQKAVAPHRLTREPRFVAVVERKTLPDLAAGLVDGVS